MSFLLCLVYLFSSLVFFKPSSPPQKPQASIGNGQCTVYCRVDYFQDGMKYQEYVYTQVSFENNPYFQAVTQQNLNDVLEFVADYEGCVENLKNYQTAAEVELYTQYAYDCASLSEGDYFYLQTRYPDYPFENYDLYIFDAEKMTLYCFESSK